MQSTKLNCLRLAVNADNSPGQIEGDLQDDDWLTGAAMWRTAAFAANQ